MMIDIDRTTGLRCLQFTKVKFPARKGDRPEKRKILFSVKNGVSLERTPKPAKAKNQKEGVEPRMMILSVRTNTHRCRQKVAVLILLRIQCSGTKLSNSLNNE